MFKLHYIFMTALLASVPLAAPAGAQNMRNDTMQQRGTQSGGTSGDMQRKNSQTQSGGMQMHKGQMPMPMTNTPAHFPPTREAYTENHTFLVKLLDLPAPIPFEDYFTLRFEVFDGGHPDQQLDSAHLALSAGMRHGMPLGQFAHGMNSTPKIESDNGVIKVDGMYFHMMGDWTLKLTVSANGKQDTAYFELPCCGKASNTQ